MTNFSGTSGSVFYSELTGDGTRDLELEIYMPRDTVVELAVFEGEDVALINLTGEQVDTLIAQLQEARKALP